MSVRKLEQRAAMALARISMPRLQPLARGRMRRVARAIVAQGLRRPGFVQALIVIVLLCGLCAFSGELWARPGGGHTYSGGSHSSGSGSYGSHGSGYSGGSGGNGAGELTLWLLFQLLFNNPGIGQAFASRIRNFR